jgi:hypothetical protein
MKLDQIPDNDSAQVVKSKKIERQDKISSFVDNNTTILEMLNPLKSINLTSNLHSFYNFKELKKQVEVLMRTQSNIIFYILHQNFMVDEAHKDFFKNMVGRFYDLPEWAWKFYQGEKYNSDTMIGLVLTENKHYYKKYFKERNQFKDHEFSSLEETNYSGISYFNKVALEEYHGGEFDNRFCRYFSPFNRLLPSNTNATWTSRLEPNTFEMKYEFGRMNPNQFFIKQTTDKDVDNHWFIASFDWIKTSDIVKEHFEKAILNLGVFASLGLDKFDEIIAAFKERFSEVDIKWDDLWESEWPEDTNKMIRSLSQTFTWSKEYIYENEDILDLDVLGLNMSVPWDMELVKFFIERGYGGRMSENKAVFEKVFEPILTDEIIHKLFNCEYERYE